MDKYLALFNYLSSIKNNTISLFFSEIEKIINEKDYSKALKVYNNKGLLDVVENLLRYKPNTYRFKALDILREEEKVQQILRAVFPQEVTNKYLNDLDEVVSKNNM